MDLMETRSTKWRPKVDIHETDKRKLSECI